MFNFDLRMTVILLFWFTMLLTVLLMTRDTVKKKRAYHFLLLSFVSFFLVASSLLYRIFFLSERMVSLIFYSLGLSLLWSHFELMRSRQVDPWKIMLMVFLTTVSITSFVFLSFDTIVPLALNISVLSVALLSIPSMLYPAYMSIKEYWTYHFPQQLIEITGFLLLMLSFQYFFLFEQLVHPLSTQMDIATIVMAFIGSSLLMIAYMYNPAYMYRIPFEIYYLLGYHDSGICFFVKRLRSERRVDLEEDPNLYLMSGILSTIDTAYRHVLRQEIEHSVQKARNMEVLFHRDPEKGISYVIIAEQVSWYLERSLDLLLHLTPGELISRTGDEVVLEQGEINAVIEPLVRQIFPFFNLLEAPSF